MNTTMHLVSPEFKKNRAPNNSQILYYVENKLS